MRSFMVGVLLVGALVSVAGQKTKYGVEVSVDKDAHFAKLKTYAWVPGWSAFNHAIDRQLVTAVDRELAAVGFVKLESEPSDLLVTYAAVQRTDVDLKSKRPGTHGLHRNIPVGTVVVLLLEPDTRRELFRARADAPLATNPAAIEEQVDALVARMFEKFPRRMTGKP